MSGDGQTKMFEDRKTFRTVVLSTFSRVSSSAVGNSPLNLDEYPTGLGNVMTAVGNSPLILDESPFRRIRQYLEPHFVVQTFDKFSEMEIRPKLGVSCLRLRYEDILKKSPGTGRYCSENSTIAL